MFTTLAPAAVPIRVPFARQLELAQRHGFDALDLPMATVQRIARDRSIAYVADLYARHGLRVGGWVLPFDYQDPRADAVGQLAALARAARVAGELGSEWCYYWIEPTSDELDYAANLKLHVQRLRPIAEILGEHGCRLGLEPIGPRTLLAGHRYAFVHTLPAALELLAAVDRPNLGLLLDCYHWYTWHGTMAELLALKSSQVVYVHVNDAPPGVPIDQQLDQVRCLPGASGVIDIVAFLQALKRIGYRGPVAVEPFDATLARLRADDRVRLAAQSLRSVFHAAGLSR